MTDDKPKKRVSLPVVGQPRRAVDDVELGNELPATRSPAAWVILGALAVFAVLLPLGYALAILIKAIYGDATRAPGTMLPAVVLVAIAVALSSFAGGYLVGRFGGRSGAREGALSGALAGLVLWAMSRLLVGFVFLAITVPLAFVGARVGRRARKPGDNLGA